MGDPTQIILAVVSVAALALSAAGFFWNRKRATIADTDRDMERLRNELRDAREEIRAARQEVQRLQQNFADLERQYERVNRDKLALQAQIIELLRERRQGLTAGAENG